MRNTIPHTCPNCNIDYIAEMGEDGPESKHYCENPECGKELCESCVRECEACGKSFCADCAREYVTDCAGVFCSPCRLDHEGEGAIEERDAMETGADRCPPRE